MFENRSIEFFEAGDKGLLSIRNLTIFVGLLVGSVIVIYMAFAKTLTGEIYGVYMFSCGGVYGFGKWQDERSTRFKMDADSDRPRPDIRTTINQPGVANISGDVKGKGDV